MTVQKEMLAEMMSKMTRKELASELGVSVTTIGCWLKKYNLSYRENRIKSLPSKFTKKQNDLLTASLLGDGTITKSKSRFRMKMKLASREYVEFLANRFMPWSRPVKEIKKKAIRRCGSKIIELTDKFNFQCEFWSVQHNLFGDLRNKWYSDGVKIVPIDLQINETILAHWFFQDGSTNPRARNAYIWTLGFSVREVTFLQGKLEEMGFVNSVHLNRERPYLQIHAASFDKLMTVLKRHLKFDCMKYKIRKTAGRLT